jgi:hypothetical protein
LAYWGWSPEAKAPVTAFRSWVVDGAFHGPPPIDKLNDLRVSLENLLKDVIRVIISDLGWPEQDVPDKLRVHSPNFTVPTGSWSEILACMMSGGAEILLAGLLPTVLVGKHKTAPQASTFLSQLNQAVHLLNPYSHDNPLRVPMDNETWNRLRGVCLGLLQTLEAWFGELPWHFSGGQAIGNKPRILTGQAWSHSHVESRLIRVALWEDKDGEMLIWNPSRINPVMTNPRLV